MVHVRFIVLPLSTYKSGPPKMIAAGSLVVCVFFFFLKNGRGKIEHPPRNIRSKRTHATSQTVNNENKMEIK